MNLAEASQRLETFWHLKAGWDSYGGKPISQKAIVCARAMLFRLGDGWQPVPCSDGGVQLEGAHLGCYVEIYIDPGEGAQSHG